MNAVVDIGPAETVLAEAATLRMRYDPARIPAGATEADLRLHVWSAGDWRELPVGSTLHLSSHMLTGQVTRLGRYAILQAEAASVQLKDTAAGPMTALVGRALSGRAYDVAGVALAGAVLTLTSLDPAIAITLPGLVVRGVRPGHARLVLASGSSRDTLSLAVAFGWRAISLVGGGNAPFHGCGIGQDDLVYCWGENQHLQGGRPTPNLALSPTLVPGLPPVTGTPGIVVGTAATCYSRGTGWVCWGMRRMSGEEASGNTEPRVSAAIPADRRRPDVRRRVAVRLRPDERRLGLLLGARHRGHPRHRLGGTCARARPRGGRPPLPVAHRGWHCHRRPHAVRRGVLLGIQPSRGVRLVRGAAPDSATVARAAGAVIVAAGAEP